MTLDELVKTLNARLNKDQAGRTTRPKKLNSLLALTNIKMFNVKTGLPEEYIPGQALPAQALDVTSAISEDLEFCVVRKSYEQAGTSGIPKPKDFARMSYMHVLYSRKGKTMRRPVRVVFGNELTMITSSSLRAPTKRNPVAILEAGAFHVLPPDVHVAMSYYRYPKKPFFDFVETNDVLTYLPPGGTHDGTGEMPSGTPSRSVELEWPETLHPAFLNMLSVEVSASLKDQFYYADSIRHQQTGK